MDMFANIIEMLYR